MEYCHPAGAKMASFGSSAQDYKEYTCLGSIWSLGLLRYNDFSLILKLAGDDQIFQLQTFWTFYTNSNFKELLEVC